MKHDELDRELNVLAVGGATENNVESIAVEAGREIARLREELRTMTELRKGERAKCELYDDENRYLREELAAAQQREREALDVLLKLDGEVAYVAACPNTVTRGFIYKRGPRLESLLSRAREQEVPRGVG